MSRLFATRFPGQIQIQKPWWSFAPPRPIFPCPICALKAPTHHQVFWLMQPGADRKNKIHAPRGFLPSHGLPPTMAAFRREAAQLQIQLRGKPRIPTGFLLIPLPRSAAAKGRMIRCSSIYIILISYSCTPVNILFRKRGPPSGAKHRRGVGAGVSPYPVRKEIKNMKKRSILYGVPHPWGGFAPSLLGLAAP